MNQIIHGILRDYDVLGIMDKCGEYYVQIPEDTVPKMAKSALYTFTATFVFSKKVPTEPYNLGRPLFAACVAALASLIYALTTPIFNMIFGDDRLLFHREFIKHIVNITLTSLLVSWLGASKINVIALPLLESFSVNLAKSFLDIIPLTAESWFHDQVLADEMRELYKQWGIDATPGTSSVFINFGIFPAIGFHHNS